MRKGPDCTVNREAAAGEILAEWLGKGRGTINSYIADGRFITREALKSLINNKAASKRFFETARPRKGRLIDELKHAGENDADIEEKVSAAMIGWLERFEASGTIEDAVDTSTPENREPSRESQHTTEAPHPAQRPSQRESRSQRASSPVAFQHHTPEEESETEAAGEPETLESLVLEAKACTGEFDTVIADENLTPPAFAESVRIAVAKLAQIQVRAQRLCQG